MRESFVFYRSFFEALVGMDKESQADCLMAIADYALNGTEPTLTPAVRMFFTLIKPQLDANNQRFENGCKGAEFGKLGGRPKKPQENPKETPKKPQENPKQTPNVNDNVNVNVNVNNNPPISPLKPKIKKLVSDDWQPNEATKSKLEAMGLDVNLVVEKFINACQAKGIKYIDFNKAILSWDWSKDKSVLKKDDDDWDNYWEKMERKYEQKVS